jgi:hypothetical protein
MSSCHVESRRSFLKMKTLRIYALSESKRLLSDGILFQKVTFNIGHDSGRGVGEGI